MVAVQVSVKSRWRESLMQPRAGSVYRSALQWLRLSSHCMGRVDRLTTQCAKDELLLVGRYQIQQLKKIEYRVLRADENEP